MLDDSILEHARSESPKECCGVIIVFKGRERYIPCRNIYDFPEESFSIHPEDYADAEDLGEIIKIVHSHPKTPPEPTQPDLVGIEKTGIPWLIVDPHTGRTTETNPSGYIAPLVGREYSFGVLDCLTLIQDYYSRKLGIELPDYPREEFWYETGENLILDRYAENGFQKVDDLQKHDVILMYGGSKVPNHLGVYLGGGDILHHVGFKLSSRDVYGNAGYWYKSTWGYLRHIDLI